MLKLFSKPSDNILDQSLFHCRKALLVTFFFALAVNILSLSVPLYSLQVLDRVISSASLETLAMLTLVIVGIFLCMHLMQVARSLTLIRVSEWLEEKLAPSFLAQSVSTAAIRGGIGGSQNLRDLSIVKNFITSAGLSTLFDAPWAIVYIIVIFMIHPDLGILALWGAAVLFVLAIFNAYATDGMLNLANEQSLRSINQAELATRNAESIEAMGMTSAVIRNWYILHKKSADLQHIASKRNTLISAVSRFLRLLLQIGVTGIGAYLVLRNELTTGGMIASSTLIAKGLSPFESAIEIWKTVTAAHKSYLRLKDSTNANPGRQTSMTLPEPSGKLSVENVLFAPPASAPGVAVKYTLRGVSFSLEPGEVLAVIGPSAAGKSSLAKLIAGVWKPLSGVVRLDGADVYSWNRNDFGRYVGYLPQGVELFNGTIKQNIARLQEDASPEAIVEAAKTADVHEMILRLPNGYETDIGIGGSSLSAGQRQRIGLARAFYGNPRLVVLDEPNANLDDAGDQALAKALTCAKEQKTTTIVISHRPSVLSCVDKILILNDGAVQAFGPRQEVLNALAQQRQQQAPTKAISS